MNKNEILKRLASRFNLNFERVEKLPLKNQKVLSSFVAQTIKELEQKSGRALLAIQGDPFQNIKEGITFGDVAEYFSAEGKYLPRIMKRIFNVNKEEDFENNELLIKLGYRIASNANVPLSNDLFERKIMETPPKGLPNSLWSLQILDLEEYSGIRFHPLGWVKPQTTVRNILDEFCQLAKR